MDRTLWATACLAVALLCAGCSSPGAIVTDAPGENGTELNVTDADTAVFDHGILEAPLISGGITPSLDGLDDQYYVTLVNTRAEVSRFDMALLGQATTADGEDPRSFVNATDFANESLVVVQAFPKSTDPDYRVEEVTRVDDTVYLDINDSSTEGTTDLTLETLFVRVPDEPSPPRRATVETFIGFTFNSSAGIVT